MEQTGTLQNELAKATDARSLFTAAALRTTQLAGFLDAGPADACYAPLSPTHLDQVDAIAFINRR